MERLSDFIASLLDQVATYDTGDEWFLDYMGGETPTMTPTMSTQSFLARGLSVPDGFAPRTGPDPKIGVLTAQLAARETRCAELQADLAAAAEKYERLSEAHQSLQKEFRGKYCVYIYPTLYSIVFICRIPGKDGREAPGSAPC